MINVLILGYTGFIGKHLLGFLTQKQNLKITVFSRKIDNSISAEITQIIGDYAQKEDLKSALENQDIVYHLISATIPATSWEQPMNEIDQNLIPFLQFLQLSSESNVKKICFASSGGTVYGLQQNELSESDPTFPYAPYGIIKNAMEHFLYYYKQKSNLNFTIFRISNVYGEGQIVSKGLGFINTALQNIALEKPIIIFGDGENVRDYIYVKDLVELMYVGISDGLNHSDIYNLGSKQVYSLNELIILFKNLVKENIEVNYLPTRPSDIKNIVLDNSKIKNQQKTDFQFTPIETGILNAYKYIKANL